MSKETVFKRLIIFQQSNLKLLIVGLQTIIKA